MPELSADDPRQVVRPLGEGLCMLTGQVSLSDVPDHYRDAVIAWREKSVERHGRTQKEGSGLGLAIAARSVELLGEPSTWRVRWGRVLPSPSG